MGDAVDRASESRPCRPAPRIPTGGSGLFRSVPVRAVATVKGVVYTDWNGNGMQDTGRNRSPEYR